MWEYNYLVPGTRYGILCVRLVSPCPPTDGESYRSGTKIAGNRTMTISVGGESDLVDLNLRVYSVLHFLCSNLTCSPFDNKLFRNHEPRFVSGMTVRLAFIDEMCLHSYAYITLILHGIETMITIFPSFRHKVDCIKWNMPSKQQTQVLLGLP